MMVNTMDDGMNKTVYGTIDKAVLCDLYCANLASILEREGKGETTACLALKAAATAAVTAKTALAEMYPDVWEIYLTDNE